MNDFVEALKEIKKESKDFQITLSRNEVLEITNEIDRLNNIINELEKFLIEEIEDYDKHINSKFITDIAKEQYEGEKVCFEDMLGKLQELKGSNDNG